MLSLQLLQNPGIHRARPVSVQLFAVHEEIHRLFLSNFSPQFMPTTFSMHIAGKVL